MKISLRRLLMLLCQAGYFRVAGVELDTDKNPFDTCRNATIPLLSGDKWTHCGYKINSIAEAYERL